MIRRINKINKRLHDNTQKKALLICMHTRTHTHIHATHMHTHFSHATEYSNLIQASRPTPGHFHRGIPIGIFPTFQTNLPDVEACTVTSR